MTTEKTEPIDPCKLPAKELAAFIDAKEKQHRDEMKVLRALLKARECQPNWNSENR